MPKKKTNANVKHRGGYEAGPKTVDELQPPPKNVTVKASEVTGPAKKKA